MPIGLSEAPKTLPKAGQTLWVDTFNGVFDSCDRPEKECDARAARIAWNNVKGKYRKVKDKWILRKSEAFQDVMLTITKASLQPDGSVRWQAVASDTGKDRAEERTSIELFQDWIDRVTYKADVSYLPAPKMPFLGVSHYPALEGFGEAGITRRMFIDGNVFKADGIFSTDSPAGQGLMDAVKTELALIKKGDQPDQPIRISAGWWDIEHYHSDSNFLFTRQALTDKCSLCDQGQTGDKVYKAGQLDHLAATRVPMNTRTTLELEEKSMPNKITRRDDAESIIGSELADQMEQRARMVGKSDTEGSELHPAMVTKAATKLGDFIKRKRQDKDMTIAQLAAATSVAASTIGDLERGDIAKPSRRDLSALATALDVEEDDLTALIPEGEAETTKAGHMKPGEFLRKIRRKKKKDHGEVEKRAGFKRGRLRRIEDDEDEIDFETMAGIADALDMDNEEMEDMGKRFGKRRKAEHKDDEDEDEAPRGRRSKKEELLARFGNKRRKTPPTRKSDIEKDFDGEEMFIPPFQPLPLGGATSMGDAQDFIDTKEKFGKLRSHWDVFQAVVANIMQSDDEATPDKVKAMGQAVKDLGRQIDTLKAGLSDAFLIQESAAAYEDDDYEDADEVDEYYEVNDNEVNTMTTEHPADQLKAAYDTALENESLSGEDRGVAVQTALEKFAKTAQGQLQAADPASQADQIATAIKGAMSDALTPLAEQMALLTAKMGNPGNLPPQQIQGVTELHEVYVPQQKSMMAPSQPPQPVQAQSGMPISPQTGKPSALTAKIRKSVGLVT